jgi:hypothetical protein
MDQDQQAAKKYQIKRSVANLELSHKDHVHHMVEQHTYRLFQTLKAACGRKNGADELDEIQDEIEQHYNQLKYLANTHTEQLRVTKMGVEPVGTK